MDIDWLADFVALAETRSFSECARRRHVTQDTLYRRIRNLEEWIGMSLVDRRHSGPVLTPAGTFFYRRAEDLLFLLEQARASLRKDRNESRMA